MDSILCPHCKKPVEISEVLRHQIEDELLQKEREVHKKELLDATKSAEEKALKKLSEQFELQMKELREDNREKEQRNKELLEKISEEMDGRRKLKKEMEDAKIEMKKLLEIEEKKIREEASKEAEEEQHSRLAEKDKQLKDALKEVEEMRRRLQQGSQQTQGEAFELEFEVLLKNQFPNDKILPVGKGIRGGDVVHEVWDSRGNYSGKILWELKNTKNWQESWVDKLKADKRTINAEEAVIISEILPGDMTTAGYRNGIWVTKRMFTLTLASTLRAKLIEMYYVRQSVKAKDGKMELMYSYLSGTEFKHRVEAIVEAFTNMQNEIEKEKRYFTNKWARDEKNIRMVIDNTYGMHGDLKAIIGRMLPQIKGIDTIDFDSKDNQLQLADGDTDE